MMRWRKFGLFLENGNTIACFFCDATIVDGECRCDAIAGEAQRGETVKQGSTGTASTRADRHRTTSGHLLHKRSD